MSGIIVKQLAAMNGFATNNTKLKNKPKKGVITPLNWQDECFYDLVDESRGILSSPTGSGKSTTIMYMAAKRLLDDPKAKIIITPPQIVIAKSFSKNKVLGLPTGEEFEWLISDATNLMESDDSVDKRKKVDKAEAFLERKTKSQKYSSRILLCSHSVAVSLHKRLKRKKNLHLFNNVSLFVDEAHHARNAQVDAPDENTELVDSNELGHLVKDFCENKKAKITLVTATFFRGDRLHIVPDSLKEKFVTYNLPFDEYLKQTRNLKSLSYHFILYPNNPAEAIAEIVKDDLGKNVIHIPYRNSNSASDDKHQEVYDVVYELADKRTKIKEDECGNILFRAKANGKMAVAVNFVDTNTKRRKKKREYVDRFSEDPVNGPDLVIALGMFKEGADYPPANRGIIIGPRNSLTEMIQLVGRPLRDFKGKEHVSIYQLLPMTFENQNPEEFKKSTNDYVKAIMGGLMMFDVLFPTLLRPKGEAKERGPREVQPNPLYELVDDEQRCRNILERIARELPHTVDDNFDVDRNKFDSVVKRVLSDYSYDEEDYDLETMSEYICGFFSKLTSFTEGLDVSDVDMDLMQEGDPVGWMKHFFSGVINGDVFAKMRALFEQKNGEQKAIERMELFAKRWSQDNMPMQKRDNSDEHKDACWRYNMCQAKRGSSHCWYPSLEKRAEELGFIGLFDLDSGEEKAHKKMYEFAERYSIDNMPTRTSDSKQKRKDAKRIYALREARKGKHSSYTWYPSLLPLSERLGFPGIFDNIDKKQNAIDKMKEFMNQFSSETIFDREKEEHLEFINWINRRSSARNNKKAKMKSRGKTNWYPELDQIAKENGFAGLFDGGYFSRQASKEKVLSKFKAIKEKYYPQKPSLSKPEERKDATFIIALRGAKKGTSNRVWYPELEEEVKGSKWEDIFESIYN